MEVYFTFFYKSGKFATGTLVRHYTSGSWVPVIVDITTNHGGYFAFKVRFNPHSGQSYEIGLGHICSEN